MARCQLAPVPTAGSSTRAPSRLHALPSLALPPLPQPPPPNPHLQVLYNIACCQCKLGDVRAGLLALSGCLELGFQDFDVIRADADLAALREDSRFEGLMQRFEPKAGSGGLLAGLFGRK